MTIKSEKTKLLLDTNPYVDAENYKKEKRQAEPGFVYVIYFKVINKYKIGCSNDLLSRIWGFTSDDLPLPLLPIILFPTNDKYGSEKKIHELVKDKRLGRKEVFDLNESDILKILNEIPKITLEFPDVTKIHPLPFKVDNQPFFQIKQKLVQEKKDKLAKSNKYNDIRTKLTALMRSFDFHYSHLLESEDHQRITSYAESIELGLSAVDLEGEAK